MSNGGCVEEGRSGVARAEQTGLELFQLASLLMGDQEQALALVEKIVAASDLDPCAAEPGAEERVRRKVTEGALVWMREREPESFAVGESGDSIGG